MKGLKELALPVGDEIGHRFMTHPPLNLPLEGGEDLKFPR